MAGIRSWAALAALAGSAPWLPAQRLKPESLQEFAAYVQSAEVRIAARRDSPHAGPSVRTAPGNGANPHRIAGAMVYDWIGTIFIPGVPVDRLVRMLQDYDHRSEYFPDVVASARLLCRSGAGSFGFTMRLKEPVVADVDSQVEWERLDEHRWRCRSISGDVREIGTHHGYLYRLNSYWRFLDDGRGVAVEGETVTLSDEFGAVMRTLGSLAGVNPEKSLKRTLNSMREAVLSRREFAPPPEGLPECGGGAASRP